MLVVVGDAVDGGVGGDVGRDRSCDVSVVDVVDEFGVMCEAVRCSKRPELVGFLTRNSVGYADHWNAMAAEDGF